MRVIGIGEQISKGMSTAGNACSGSPEHDGSISGKALLDLNRSPPVDGAGGSEKEATIVAISPVAVDLDRSPFAGDGGSQNEALNPIAAGKRASPVVVDLDRSPLAGEGGSQNEALNPIAPGTPVSPVVVDLDGSPVAGGEGSQKAPIAAGTWDSPIDVESLVDEGRRNRTGTMRRRRVVVVDLEADTDLQGGGDARTLYFRPGGSKRRRVAPVIRLSPVRVERSSNQQRSAFVPVSRPRANAAPKEPVFTCPVCLNKMEQPSATSCGHVFCKKCIKAFIKAQKKCPTCSKKLGPKNFHRVYLPATADQC